jgi:hypothetical protein
MCRYVSVIGVCCYRSARGGFEDVVGKEGRLGKEFRSPLFIPKTSQLNSRLIHPRLFIHVDDPVLLFDIVYKFRLAFVYVNLGRRLASVS